MEETVAAWGKWLNVKSKKVEKAIFQSRFAPHFSPPWASRPGSKSAAGGQDTRSPLGGGPTRPRPQSAHLPVGPASIRSLAEDVTALNIY